MFFAAGYATFFVCDKLLHFDLFAAKQIANVVGLSLNFLVQRYWAFSTDMSKANQSGVMAKYGAVTLMNFMLDFGIIALLKKAGISPYIGQFISATFFTPWNYLWYKHVIFKDKR